MSRKWQSLGMGALAGSSLLWLASRPVPELRQDILPRPAADYLDAANRVQGKLRREEIAASVHPACRTRLLSHGRRQRRVYILLHGFTSCPQQFVALAERLHDAGHNVYIPRTPFHGLRDDLGEGLVWLTAEGMALAASEAVDIAAGLGREIVVIGLSGGGTAACWLAQNRAGITLAVALSPFLGIYFIPAAVTTPFTRLLLALPNFLVWWDPRAKESNPSTVYYAYPRYASHALVEVMRLGLLTQQQARRRPPQSSTLMISNASDRSINARLIQRLVKSWQKGATAVSTYEFPADLNLLHDFIAPEKPGSQIDLVYPRLLNLVEGELAAGPLSL